MHSDYREVRRQINIDNDAKRKRRDRMIEDLFSSERGKEVLAEIRKICGYDESSVCFHAIDPHQTMFQEGKRFVYLYILKAIQRSQNERSPAERTSPDAGSVSPGK